MRILTCLVLGLTLASSGACYVAPAYAPPAAAPLAEVPKGLEELSDPPVTGVTRITLDANGVAARVDEVVDSTNETASGWGRSEMVTVNGSSVKTKPICITPCQADFTPGLHVLQLSERGGTGQDTVEVQVGSHPKVVRIALGHGTFGKHSSATGVSLFAVGLTAALVGTVLWASASANREYGAGLEAPGIGLTVGGAAVTTLSVPFLVSTPDTIQRSAKTEFALPQVDSPERRAETAPPLPLPAAQSSHSAQAPIRRPPARLPR
jgi:hypothetical protein